MNQKWLFKGKRNKKMQNCSQNNEKTDTRISTYFDITYVHIITGWNSATKQTLSVKT
jgi:hypothetical protein